MPFSMFTRPAVFYPAGCTALVLTALALHNYIRLILNRQISFPPAWLLFVATLAVWPVLVNYTGDQEKKLKNYANYINRAGIFISLVHLATEAVFITIYSRVTAIQPGKYVTAADLQNLADTLLFLPAVLISLGTLGALYYLKTNPDVKQWFKSDTPRFWGSRPDTGDKPALFLCTDKKTGVRATIPYQDQFRHLLVLGPTGCGKTSLILIPLAHQLVQNHRCSLLVIDPKGDFAYYAGAMCRHYGRNHVLFDPARPDCPYFNPLTGKENDVVENMVTTLEILADENIRYFKDQNARLLRNGIRLLKRLRGDDANLLLLNDLLHNRDGFGYRCLAELNRQAVTDGLKQNQEIIGYFRDEYFSPQAKTFEHTSGVRNQIANLTDNEHLRRALNPPAGQKPDIDFDQLLQHGGVVCINLAQGQLRGLARYLGLFLQMNYQAAVFRRPAAANRLAAYEIIDEVQVIANEQFAEMVQQARSLECAVIAASQSLEQLALHLGNKGSAFLAALQTNFQNRVIFAGLSPADARLFSDWSGLRPEQKVTRGWSAGTFDLWSGAAGHRGPVKSKTISEHEKPVFSPDQIMYLKDREILYFISRHMRIEQPRIGVVRWLPPRLHGRFGKLAEETTPRTVIPAAQTEIEERGELVEADELLS